MSTSGSKSNEHVAHFLVDIHIQNKDPSHLCKSSVFRIYFTQLGVRTESWTV